MKISKTTILGIIQSIVAIGAIPAGFLMIAQPDGTGLGMAIDFLQNSPFQDFFIPGLFLFIVNGLFNLVAAILSFLKNKFSGILGIVLGATLVLWISVQVYFISLVSFMQPLFFCIGIFEIVISFLIIQKNKQVN